MLFGCSGFSVVFLMVIYHGGVIHLIDVVAGEDYDIIGVIAVYKTDVLIDRVSGTGIPVGAFLGLVGLQAGDAGVDAVQIPRLTVTDIFVEFERLILGQNAYRLDAGVDTVRQGKVDDSVFTSERNSGLRDLLGQNAEARALTACKQHSHYFFFRYHVFPPNIQSIHRISCGIAFVAEPRA